MSKVRDLAAVVIAVCSLGVSGYLFVNRPVDETAAESAPEGSPAPGAGVTREDIEELRRAMNELRAEVASLKVYTGEAVRDDGAELGSLGERLESMESSLARLTSAYEGISLEGASAERAALFASEKGAIKADEYLEAGKFAIAAEGYMTYYRNHPDDPDAQNILQKARNAYQKAGYSDMAMWVQEEMMEIFPGSRGKDLMELAAMKKRAGSYDDAIAHAAEAAELTNNPQERLWNRLYWAWYNELRDGPAGGLSAYRQVQQEIEAAGFKDEKMWTRAQEKIDQLQRQVVANP